MPASYEKEALKAQAVCARTYAYRQIQGNAYGQYGAHVDDSTSFQVYNNINTSERTDQAVNETYGQMLFYNNKPIEAFYYSHFLRSWGRWKRMGQRRRSIAISAFYADQKRRQGADCGR